MVRIANHAQEQVSNFRCDHTISKKTIGICKQYPWLPTFQAPCFLDDVTGAMKFKHSGCSITSNALKEFRNIEILNSYKNALWFWDFSAHFSNTHFCILASVNSPTFSWTTKHVPPQLLMYGNFNGGSEDFPQNKPKFRETTKARIVPEARSGRWDRVL